MNGLPLTIQLSPNVEPVDIHVQSPYVFGQTVSNGREGLFIRYHFTRLTGEVSVLI